MKLLAASAFLGGHPPKADSNCVIAGFAADLDARLPRVAALQNAYR
jgi:hypothetical protein